MSLDRRNFVIDNTSLELYIYIDEENNPWFKAKEIAKFLGYVNSTKAIQDNVSEFNKIMWFKIPSTTLQPEIPSNWHPNTIFINEAGLYELMLRSKLKCCKHFQNWVTSEVLPSLRDASQKKLIENYINVAEFEKKENLNKSGYVYLATTSHLEKLNIYKIGSSFDVEKRMIQLNTASPFDWYILKTFETKNKLQSEFNIHISLIDYNFKREFFKFSSSEEAIQIVEDAYLNNI